jgi:hypothetical protein
VTAANDDTKAEGPLPLLRTPLLLELEIILPSSPVTIYGETVR